MRAAAWSALLLAAGCAMEPPAPTLPQVALKNPGFESPARPAGRCPEGWECASHAGPGSFRFMPDEAHPASGQRAYCIERTQPELWAVMSQTVDAAPLKGATLRFSVSVRIDGEAKPGAGPQIVIHGFQQNPLDHAQKVVERTRGWERLSVESRVGFTARLVEVGVALEGGDRACLDDARLEIVEPASP